MNKNNMHVLARAVVIDSDHILLCKTLDMNKNFYFLPGGHVEHGESLEIALHREMLEETGCEIKVLRFLGCLENIFENSDSCKCHNHEYGFIFEVESKDLKLHIPLKQLETNMQLLWMPLAELNNIVFKAKPLQDLITKWLAKDSQQSFVSVMLKEH